MCVGGGSRGAQTGGSGGGFLESTITVTTKQTITVTVGNGGQSVVDIRGGNTSVSFSNNPEYNMIAYGGTPTMSGAPTANPAGARPPFNSGYGGAGGYGGGGGAGGAGVSGTYQTSGAGGPGKAPTKPGILTQYPTTYWAAGGGGESAWDNKGNGGIGGGGGGFNSQGAGLQGPNGYAGVQAQSVIGQTNSGSGGGPTSSSSGGSGIVMIAVKVPI